MTAHTQDKHLACMEVWGGNTRAQTSVRMPGNDVDVACAPWKGDAGGGDIYLMSNCMAGLITRFMLADVAGHGQTSNDLALALRRLMRKHINTADQTRLARALNREFAAQSSMGRFATALLATYFAPTSHLIICNAGHPAPLRYRASDQSWSLLHPEPADAVASEIAAAVGVPNLPLGILEPMHYAQFAVKLEPADAVVMYTDALIEAPGRSGAQLGERGLLELAGRRLNLDQPDVAGQILEGVRAEAESAELDDDATVLVIRHHGAAPPRQSFGERARALGRLIGLS